MSYGGYKDQGNPYGNPSPYNSASNTEAGYGQEQHELQTYQPGQYESYGQQQQPQSYSNAPASNTQYGDYSAPAPAAAESQSFFQRRADVGRRIEELDREIGEIRSLQHTALGSTNPDREQAQVEEQVQRFRLTAQDVRAQIQELKNEAGADPTKAQHVNLLMKDFRSRYDTLLQLESNFNRSLRGQMERQYRAVNPDASEEEIQAVVQGRTAADGGIFQQALLNSRTNEARSVLGNVQARHNEIQRIERSMQELAELFQDLDTMVVQQEAVIANAERQTEQTTENINKGTEEVDKGIVHARRTRRNKWICFWIVVLIIVIAIAVGVAVGLTQKN